MSASERFPAARTPGIPPVKNISQNRRRWSNGNALFTRWRISLANRPASATDAGIHASSFSRSCRARTGAWPPLLILMMIGERSIIAGKIKRLCAGSSTAFTKMPAASHAWKMTSFRASSSVAAITKRAPWISATAKARTITVSPACGSVENPGSTSSPMTVTDAPASSSSRVLRSPISPAPTTRTGCLVTSM